MINEIFLAIALYMYVPVIYSSIWKNAGRNMMGFGQNGGVSASSAQTQHIYIWFFMELFYLQKSSICIPHCCLLC